MKIFAHISWLFATIVIFMGLTLMIILFYIVPKPYSRKISSWFIRLSIMFSTDIQGEEDPKANMFLLNHQCDLDIIITETITKKDLTWVAKKELFEVPFFGLALRLAKDIPVDRQSKTSLIKLLKDAKDRLDNGRVITMFPEGTRSTKGKMLPFKSGARIVADKYSLIVQPIVLMQTAAYYNLKKFYYKPGRIKIIFLDSFVADKSNPEWLNDLRKTMQKVYDDELASNTNHR